MSANESLWLDQALEGDQQAFAQLVDLYQRPVFNLCYRMLGTAEDAEDASQETFLRAYRSLKRYDASRSFITWLLSIAAHYCIDQIRRRRYPVISIEDLPVPDLPDHSPGMEAKLGNKQERERVRSLLQVLESTDRAIVVLYYWYDYSYEEIGQALSLTLSAIKSRLHRARRAMAESWKENERKVEIPGRFAHESQTF
ncbi:MAG TPA: sigma-70 family RNA polymerase sigma factor [Anaerolineales bacterium]|nr:sigma-70 family RNA polymerase sigma factor [Anaerolineales bacterium]